jgi:hypothetical protein
MKKIMNLFICKLFFFVSIVSLFPETISCKEQSTESLKSIAKEGDKFAIIQSELPGFIYNKKEYSAKKGSKFKIIIIDIQESECIIKFTNISSEKCNKCVDMDHIYRIKKELITEETCEFLGGFNFSMITLPFKYRIKNQANEDRLDWNVNINGSIGYSFKLLFIKRFTPFGFAGLTSISNPSITTNDEKIEEELKTDLGLSIGFGLSAIIISNIQIGFVCGWDWIPGTKQDSWHWDGEPWISFGIGVEILNF